MKKTTSLHWIFLSCFLFLAGCLFPRYTMIREDLPPAGAPGAMTLKEASEIVRSTLAEVPAGHHPDHPGDKNIGKYTTAVRLRKHNRTGLILVEVKDNSRIMLEFYVRDMEDAAKFESAVWRLRQEYLKK